MQICRKKRRISNFHKQKHDVNPPIPSNKDNHLQNRVSLIFVREPTTNRLIKYDTPNLIAEKSYQGWCWGLSCFENDNIFKAVELSYNATHKNWQLSIKQVVEKD